MSIEGQYSPENYRVILERKTLVPLELKYNTAKTEVTYEFESFGIKFPNVIVKNSLVIGQVRLDILDKELWKKVFFSIKNRLLADLKNTDFTGLSFRSLLNYGQIEFLDYDNSGLGNFEVQFDREKGYSVIAVDKKPTPNVDFKKVNECTKSTSDIISAFYPNKPPKFEDWMFWLSYDLKLTRDCCIVFSFSNWMEVNQAAMLLKGLKIEGLRSNSVDMKKNTYLVLSRR
jgi:hypothetical protein